jgi:hypothetical protein
MQSITSIPNSKKGFEFFSSQQLMDNIDTAKNAGFRIMFLDLEGDSPDDEEAAPVTTFRNLDNFIDDYNAANGVTMQLGAAPGYHITNQNSKIDGIAPEVTWYHIQGQQDQDNDGNCTAMQNFVNTRNTRLESAKPAIEDETSFQVTLTAHAASGKTAYETAFDCITTVMPDDVDGVTVWYGGGNVDNGEYEDIYTHAEDLT